VLDVDAGHGEAALARLARFKLRVDCELTLRSVDGLAVRGPAAADGPEALGLVPGDEALVLDADWPSTPGFDVLGPVTDLGSTLAVGPTEALEALRIRLGRPAMGSELDESTIPAAAGIVDASVDFTKGCYVGQELVARVDSRGSNTPTHLRRVVLGRHDAGADVPAAGFEQALVGSGLEVDGAEVGRLTSVAPRPADGGPWLALAYVKRSVAPPADVVVAASVPVAARVESIPG
jgi:folate-binding protein YgfZ